MKLIDKDVLIAEIERQENEMNYEPFTDEVFGKRMLCKHIKTFLDTLEVKEVDLEKEYEEYVVDDPILGEDKHLEVKAGKWYICYRAYCCRADHLTVKEGERILCEKDGVVKGFVIKDAEKYFKECNTPAPYEDEQDTTQFKYNGSDDVRRQSTIQVLEYARSLDAYNQYGKEDIDKNIAWLEKQRTSNEAIEYLKKNHSPSEISDFQEAMNIAVAKAYDKGKRDTEKQGEQKPTIPYKAIREGVAHFGITQYQIDNWLRKYIDFVEEPLDCPQNHQDVNHPNGCIVLEDFSGGEGFKQVEEIEEMIRIWNKEINIKHCIGMCLTDANEQRFKDYSTNLKDCLAWLEKQGELIPQPELRYEQQ